MITAAAAATAALSKEAGAGSGNGYAGSEAGVNGHDRPVPLSRYLIAADRCYCLISRVPFFSLHFEAWA
jgi:hypothetical protein